MPVSIKNQSVLVIGASSGIGRAAAALFAREGAHVIAVARRENRLLELQSELSLEGLALETMVGDAADAARMEAVAQQVREKFRKIDIVVFATGTNTPDRNLKRLNVGLWDMMINVNLNSAYYVTQAVLPAMREAGAGHLIYISSISGLTADVSGSAYQAAKRGLLGLAHAIRVEEKENGIRTCVVCPGLVDTEILEKRPVKPDAATMAKAMQPEDVAELILSIAKLPPRAAVPEVQILPTML
jgi:NADP-dependent 3-hydroxy acid dehydrogenase YdfG